MCDVGFDRIPFIPTKSLGGSWERAVSRQVAATALINSQNVPAYGNNDLESTETLALACQCEQGRTKSLDRKLEQLIST